MRHFDGTGFIHPFLRYIRVNSIGLKNDHMNMEKSDSSVRMAHRRVRLTYILKLLGVAVLYALLAKVVLTFFSANGVVSIVWPPSGLALAVLLIGGKRYFPGVFLGAFLANAMAGLAMGVAAAIAMGNTLEALLGVWLLTRNGRFDSSLRALGDYLRLIVLAGFFACSVAALNGATVLLLSGFLAAGAYFPNLINWWMGDVLGVTLVAPFMLVWRRMPGGWLGAEGVVEAALVLGLTLLAGQIVFLGWFYDAVGQVALGYWMFLFVAWAAVRLGIHGVVTVLSMVAIQGMLGAAQGVGFFAHDIAKTGLTTYWCYMMVLSAVGIALATYFSERKLIEKALRESEENLNRAQAVGQIGSWLLDIRTNRLEWSAETCRMFGFPQREAVDLATFLAAIHPDDRDFVLKAWGEAMAGATYDIEHRIVVDGQVRWVRERARIERDAEGRPLTGIGTVQDVTELKRIESALSESEERYRALFEQGAEPVWLVDAQTGVFVDFNTAAHESLGYTREEFTRLNIADMEAVESPQEVALHIAKVMAEGSDVFETVHRTRRGELRNILASVNKVTSGGITYLQSTMRDITGRKLAERALSDSEARFRNLVETTSDWIWEVDENIVFTYVSPKIHDILGYEAAEVIGKTPFDLMSPDEAKRVADIAGTIAATRKPFINLENTSLHKDGHPVVIETSGVPVIGAKGELHGYRGVNRDITDRKEHEEELKRSNADLEQFSYAVSHDMRQPLRMISSYLQLLEMGLAGQLDNEKRGYFDSAIEGAKRIDQMLVALLEYSRIGRMGEPPTVIDSRATLGEALQFLQPAIAEAHARLDISGDWPRIMARRDEILRLLQNLVGNAIKYRVAGRTTEIAVTSGIVKNEWHLCVADNGVGIIPDQIKRLFQVFQRLQSREAYEGTGIGLALCRKIAEHHKGRIWAESPGEGQGSKFHVVLPVLQMQIMLQ